jgi:polyribonucleotide nucleotidyltransferase
MKKVFELDFYGRKIVVEHGQVAKQADGAVLVKVLIFYQIFSL